MLHTNLTTWQGRPVRVNLLPGTYELDAFVLDEGMSPSELTIEASEGVTLMSKETTLLTLKAGSPPVRIVGIAISGRIEVLNGSLQLSNCTVRAVVSSERRRLGSDVSSGHAVVISGGSVHFLDVKLSENIGGAIFITDGALWMQRCSLISNSATRGAALFVKGGTVAVEETEFSDNVASESGGALYIENGRVSISNRTLLRRNSAPRGAGASIFSSVALHYVLPTPLARWVLIPDGRNEATLAAGAIDDDFPYPCSAGLYGNSYLPFDQSGPLCSGACPAGYSCGTATAEPLPCPNGTFCRAGSPAPSDCPAGTAGLRSMLTEESACDECEAGTFCPIGSVSATPCSFGTYGPSARLGACLVCLAGSFQGMAGETACEECEGGYCPAGSASPVACAAGTTSSGTGLRAADDCEICSFGSYCVEGSSVPSECPAGTAGRAMGLGAVDFCSACPDLMTSAAGSSACSWCKEGHYSLPAFGLSADEASCAPCPQEGFLCPENSTLSTIELERGYWRMSPTVQEASACIVRLVDNRTVSACAGGRTDNEGSSNCVQGHQGPLCQVCEGSHLHFDDSAGLCTECPTLLGRISIGAVAVGVLILAVILLGSLAMLIFRNRAVGAIRDIALSIRRLVSKVRNLHLMPRVKLLIMFYQIVVAMPQVYGVSMPQWYSKAMNTFAWFDLDWTNYLFPGACISGGFRTRLLLRGVAPLLLLATLPCIAAVREGIRARSFQTRFTFQQVLLSALPAMLFLAHLLCTSVSAGIFAAWKCDSYLLDSTSQIKRSFLREDLSVVCAEAGVTTSAHAQLTGLAAVFVVIWPLGLPLCDLLLLVPCRKSIQQRRTTPWVLATEYLHKEYLLAYYWWDFVPLLLRLTLNGFVVLIPEQLEMWRILIGTMVALFYLIILELVRPYKRRDVNFIAIATQVSLVCCFLGATFLKFYNRLADDYSIEEAEQITGFSSGRRIVIAMLVFNLNVVALIGGLTVYQLGMEDLLPTIRRIDNGRAPELRIAQGLKYHLFLSHVWSSGQDQMAIVKRQLQLLLPSIHVFLDVDDLDFIDNLEQHVGLSQSVLTFLSRGYFFSANVQRELRACLSGDKPLILLHESDTAHGGAPLQQLKRECPQSSSLRLRDFLFDDREVISWLRVRDFQLVSLRMIVSLVLAHSLPTSVPSPMSTPRESAENPSTSSTSGRRIVERLRRSFASEPRSPRSPSSPSASSEAAPLGSELYIPGDTIASKRLILSKPTTLIVSSNNPGAVSVAEELRAQDTRLSIASYDEFQLALSFSQGFGRSGNTSFGQQMRQLPLRAQQQVQRLKRLRKLTSSRDTFLVYLDSSTWEGRAGSQLAEEVIEVMRAGYPLLLLHEQDPARGHCEFERFCVATPASLLSMKIYGQMAIPMHHGPHRQVSLALAAKELGAVPTKASDQSILGTLSGACTQVAQRLGLRSSSFSVAESTATQISSPAPPKSAPPGVLAARDGGSPGAAESYEPPVPFARTNSTKRAIHGWLADQMARERSMSFSGKSSRSNSVTSQGGLTALALPPLTKRGVFGKRIGMPTRLRKSGSDACGIGRARSATTPSPAQPVVVVSPTLARLSERPGDFSERASGSPSGGRESERSSMQTSSKRESSLGLGQLVSAELGGEGSVAASPPDQSSTISQRRLSEAAMQVGCELTVQTGSIRSSLGSVRSSQAAGSSRDSARCSSAEILAASGFITGSSTPRSIRSSESHLPSFGEADALARADVLEMEDALGKGEAAMCELHQKRKMSVVRAIEALQVVELEIGVGPSASAQAGLTCKRAVEASISVKSTTKGSGSALERARALRQAYRTLDVDRVATSDELQAALTTQLRASSNDAEKAAARHAYAQIVVSKPSHPRPAATTTGASSSSETSSVPRHLLGEGSLSRLSGQPTMASHRDDSNFDEFLTAAHEDTKNNKDRPARQRDSLRSSSRSSSSETTTQEAAELHI